MSTGEIVDYPWGVVKPPTPREKRQHRRYRLRPAYRLRATALPSLGLDGQKERRSIEGRIRDISGGGACLLTDQVVEIDHLLRCEIVLADPPVAIPSLVRVLWCQKGSPGFRYRAGLQFLLS